MCSNADDLRHRAKWDGVRGSSRRNLLSQLQRTCSYHPFNHTDVNDGTRLRQAFDDDTITTPNNIDRPGFCTPTY